VKRSTSLLDSKHDLRRTVSSKLARLISWTFLSLFGDKIQRHNSRHRLLAVLAARLSFRLYNKDLVWPGDHESLTIYRGFPEATVAITDRNFTLYSLAKSTRNVEGDTVECGVFRGATSFMIGASQRGTGKKHYVFDSFEGLSVPGEEDLVSKSRPHYWKAHDLSAPEDVVRRNLAALDDVCLFKGWIPSRFREVADTRFSFVHIDVDLYRPTLDSLEFFYERLNSSGLIVCDDYGNKQCPGAKKALDSFMADKPEDVVHLATGQGVIWKRNSSFTFRRAEPV